MHTLGVTEKNQVHTVKFGQEINIRYYLELEYSSLKATTI